VTFTINKDGILKVAAKEMGEDGQSGSIDINQQSNRLSREEIDEMVAEAERFADDDKVLKERIDAKSALEQYTNSVQSLISGNVEETKHVKEQLTPEELEQVTDALRDATDFISHNHEAEPEEYHDMRKETEKIVGPILSKYMSAGGAPGAVGEEDEEEGDDDDEL